MPSQKKQLNSLEIVITNLFGQQDGEINTRDPNLTINQVQCFFRALQNNNNTEKKIFLFTDVEHVSNIAEYQAIFIPLFDETLKKFVLVTLFNYKQETFAHISGCNDDTKTNFQNYLTQFISNVNPIWWGFDEYNSNGSFLTIIHGLIMAYIVKSNLYKTNNELKENLDTIEENITLWQRKMMRKFNGGDNGGYNEQWSREKRIKVYNLLSMIQCGEEQERKKKVEEKRQDEEEEEQTKKKQAKKKQAEEQTSFKEIEWQPIVEKTIRRRKLFEEEEPTEQPIVEKTIRRRKLFEEPTERKKKAEEQTSFQKNNTNELIQEWGEKLLGVETVQSRARTLNLTIPLINFFFARLQFKNKSNSHFFMEDKREKYDVIQGMRKQMKSGSNFTFPFSFSRTRAVLVTVIDDSDKTKIVLVADPLQESDGLKNIIKSYYPDYKFIFKYWGFRETPRNNVRFLILIHALIIGRCLKKSGVLRDEIGDAMAMLNDRDINWSDQTGQPALFRLFKSIPNFEAFLEEQKKISKEVEEDRQQREMIAEEVDEHNRQSRKRARQEELNRQEDLFKQRVQQRTKEQESEPQKNRQVKIDKELEREVKRLEDEDELEDFFKSAPNYFTKAKKLRKQLQNKGSEIIAKKTVNVPTKTYMTKKRKLKIEKEKLEQIEQQKRQDDQKKRQDDQKKRQDEEDVIARQRFRKEKEERDVFMRNHPEIVRKIREEALANL